MQFLSTHLHCIAKIEDFRVVLKKYHLVGDFLIKNSKFFELIVDFFRKFLVFKIIKIRKIKENFKNFRNILTGFSKHKMQFHPTLNPL